MALTAAIYARPNPTLVFLGSTFSASDLTTYTFSAQSLGKPDHCRTIIVGVHSEDAATNYSISSITVQDIAATSAVSIGTSPAIKAAIWTAPVRSGWIGDVVITFSEAITCCGISLWAAYNLRSNTLTDSNTSATDAGPTAVSTHAHGIVIAVSTNAAAGDTCTWTGGPGLTEQYDVNATDIQMTGASAVLTAAGGTPAAGGRFNVVADYVTGTAVQNVAASFR